MTAQEPTTPGRWVDPDEAEALAVERHREAGVLADASRRWAQWWESLDEQNGFRARWDRVTGRTV